jgi:hypothetical protein
MNSVPTSGAMAIAMAKLAIPLRTTTARGVTVARRQRRGAAVSRRPAASNGCPKAGIGGTMNR